MKRRNAIMAALSIIFLILLLFTMVLAAGSAPNALASLAFGGSLHNALVGLVIISFPVFSFVIITIILLVMEASRATRVPRKHWLSGRPIDPSHTIHVETSIEGKDR
jgi:hypothetical protein